MAFQDGLIDVIDSILLIIPNITVHDWNYFLGYAASGNPLGNSYNKVDQQMLVQRCLDQGAYDIQWAITMAVKHGNLDMVKYLELAANNKYSIFWNPILNFAITKERLEVAEYISYKCHRDLLTRKDFYDCNWDAAMFCAIKENNIHLVSFYVKLSKGLKGSITCNIPVFNWEFLSKCALTCDNPRMSEYLKTVPDST